MPLITLPDVEIIVGDFIATHPDVVALQANVAGRIPADFSKPFVRVTRLDAQKEARSRVNYLMSYLMDFDCYASSTAVKEDRQQAEASLLGRTVRAVLESMQERVIGGVSFTCAHFAIDARLPDMDFSPARERVKLSVEIYGRAV